jgi:hypothetical protein
MHFLFAVRHIKTHNKEALCRAPEIKHTANPVVHVKIEFSRSDCREGYKVYTSCGSSSAMAYGIGIQLAT